MDLEMSTKRSGAGLEAHPCPYLQIFFYRLELAKDLKRRLTKNYIDLNKVFGACVIVVGLYLVIWGSSKDDSSKSSGNDLDAPVEQQLPVIRPANHQEQHSATPREVPGEESV
nr:WAT1-related protein At2g39510-like [Ipomoea batatas]